MPDDKPSLAAPAKDAPADTPAPSKKDDAAPEKEGADKDQGFSPGPDHPRFKEVYWRMKKSERDAEERAKDIEALRAHNAQIVATLEELRKGQASKSEEPEPDPAADPEGYKAWHRIQLHKKEKDYQEKLEQQRIANLIEIEAGLHEDYYQAIALIEREMALDPALKKKIWGSPNPAREAYKLGRKKMDEAASRDKEEVERQERLDAGRVEKDSPPPPAPKEEELTDDEKRVVRNLFRDMDFKEAAKKYREQKKAMARG